MPERCGVCVLGIRHITYLPFHYHGNQSAGELKPNKSFLKMKEFIEITKYVLLYYSWGHNLRYSWAMIFQDL